MQVKGNLQAAITAQLTDSDTYHAADGRTDNVAASVLVSGNVVFDKMAQQVQWDEYDEHGYTKEEEGTKITRLAPKWEITFTDPNTSGENS